MATVWVTTKSVKNLQGQVNRRFVFRDKTSDGTIGDLAHQLESSSSHNPDKTGRAEWKDGDAKNEVRAWDADSDLRDVVYGKTMEDLVQYLVGLGRAAYKAGKYFPIRYIIYKGRIWSVSSGWVTKKYTGASPHNEHAHFTFTFSQKADEDDTYDYQLEKLGEGDIPMDQKTFNTLMTGWAKSADGQAAIGTAIINTKTGDAAYTSRTIGDVLRDFSKIRGVWWGEAKDTANAKLSTTSPLQKVLNVPGQVSSLASQVSSLSSTVAAIKSAVDKFTSS